MTATENLSQRQDRMEETLVNLQQVTNQINDTLRRLAEGQMVTPPQHERPKERPAQLLEKGIQILETRRRGQPRTQQECHEDRVSKGKGKVANLPPESGTKSSSTNRDRVQPSRKSTNSQDRLNGEQGRPSRSVFERISRESRQDPADLRQYLERRRNHDRTVSHHNDQSRSRRTISLDSSHRSQKTLPDQPTMHQDNERRPPVPPTKDDAFPLNVDVHNLRIALDALAGWDDELADGYRQSPFSEEV
ncbi:hypothetical protein PanWU01x14_180150 [Parasponia andersonii]|uniref:Uncharacterized protein n=1 Tax=Parasponia andersonii TaxID=3476 RepID=A0A2P5C6A1_PARAD|nr:hypothetical protein PanWU01x14_180150 [Parasponia andersonii]